MTKPFWTEAELAEMQDSPEFIAERWLKVITGGYPYAGATETFWNCVRRVERGDPVEMATLMKLIHKYEKRKQRNPPCSE